MGENWKKKFFKYYESYKDVHPLLPTHMSHEDTSGLRNTV